MYTTVIATKMNIQSPALSHPRWICASLALMSLPSAFAQNNTIPGFVSCINNNNKGFDIVRTVNNCLPAGCKLTVTMSAESTQPACKTGALTNNQLPRIILNCPGTAAGVRFRPTFALCSSDNQQLKIEVGEEVGYKASPTNSMTMGELQYGAGGAFPANPFTLTEVLNQKTMANQAGTLECQNCHGAGGMIKPATLPVQTLTAILGGPVDPFGYILRRPLTPNVINTTEPNRTALVNPTGFVKQSVADVCMNNLGGQKAPVPDLCMALQSYQDNKSCGGKNTKTGCSGIAGGGLLKNGATLSSVAVDISGSTTNNVFQARQIDANITAYNYSSQTLITSFALDTLMVTPGNNGDFSATGSGTAIINNAGQSTKINLTVSRNGNNNSYSIMITDNTNKLLAGGSATLNPPTATLVLNQ